MFFSYNFWLIKHVFGLEKWAKKTRRGLNCTRFVM